MTKEGAVCRDSGAQFSVHSPWEGVDSVMHSKLWVEAPGERGGAEGRERRGERGEGKRREGRRGKKKDREERG